MKRTALREGATQFKANFTELRDVIRQSAWAKQNILIAGCRRKRGRGPRG